VQQLLHESGFKAGADQQRGFDHGTFSMMQPIYPQADVPMVQLSMRHHMDPAEHIEVGRVLAPLRDENILIIGSGQSYHNLRRWNLSGAQPAAEFDAWLRRALLNTTPAERHAALLAWEQAPAAREAHPHDDHLIPLMVVAGAAGDDPATAIYGEQFMGCLAVSSFRFGGGPPTGHFDQLAGAAAQGS
jgi:aromatic ring-opening dioxygenase catalytic subunit (LigB family)